MTRQTLFEQAAAKHKVIALNGEATVPSRMVEPQQAARMMQQPTESEYAGPYSCMRPIGQNHQQEKQKQDSPFVSRPLDRDKH
jgi:hypothetical protein